VPPAYKAHIRGLGEGIVVELPSSVAGAFKPGAEICAFSHGVDAVLLTREGSSSSGYFAGSIESISIGEVIAQIVAGVRTGKMIVGLGAIRKTVSFRDGQIVFATSSQQHERLGVLLTRLKMILPEQLKEALAQVRPGRKIGQILTHSKMVSPSNLYSAMTFLVREIVVGLFELNEGGFLFLEGIPATEDALKLPERTRNILLQGMERAAQMDRLRRKLPWNLRVTAGSRPSPPESEALLARVGNGRDLLMLRQFFDGSDYAFLSSVDELLQSGCLAQQPQPPPTVATTPAEIRSPLELYAALIKTICQALKSAGHDLRDLQSFFSDPLPGMEEPFAGVTLSDDGYLDFDQVMTNMGGPTSALRRAKAYEALDGFVAYALFSAKNVMSQELAESLAEEFRRIQGELGG
jgi:hypothetical protein